MAKLYVDRVASVSAVTVLTDGPGLDKSNVSLVGDVDMSGELDVVLSEFGDVLDGSVGKYNGGEACIGVEDEAKPVSFTPYHVPDAIKEKVKVAVEQLVSQGWVEDTDSPWSNCSCP